MKLDFTNQTATLDSVLSFKQMGVLEKVLNEAVELNGDNFHDVTEITNIADSFGLTVNIPSGAEEGKELGGEE